MDVPLVVDFANIYHRAYHVAPPLSFNGKDTGTTFLFFKIIKRIHSIKPGPIIFAMEGGKNYRNDLDPLYKANRNIEIDTKFLDQREDVIKMLTMGNAIVWRLPGYEADDLIASYALNNDCFIYSNDKDIQASLREGITILRNEKDGSIREYNLADFEDEYHFSPKDWHIYRALLGDHSDNIRGITGFGPITAQKAMVRYASDYNKMKISGYGKAFDNLRSNWDTFLRNMDLIKMKTDAVLTEEPRNLDWNTMITFLRTLGVNQSQLVG